MSIFQPDASFTLTEMVELTQKFHEFDQNNDGRVDSSELLRLVQSLGESATQEDIDFVIEQFDENHDDGLDLGEFLKLMKALREVGEK